MSIKQSFFILSVLIDRPKGPDSKIDVYLQLLIEELNELWKKGIPTYDVLKKRCFNFMLHYYRQSVIFLRMQTCLDME